MNTDEDSRWELERSVCIRVHLWQRIKRHFASACKMRHMSSPLASPFGESSAAENKVGMATGLRATVQSIVWLGTELGIFRKHGLDVDFVRFEVGGPASAAGLVRGEWAFVQ